jgi:hypothetical protein
MLHNQRGKHQLGVKFQKLRVFYPCKDGKDKRDKGNGQIHKARSDGRIDCHPFRARGHNPLENILLGYGTKSYGNKGGDKEQKLLKV